MMKFSWLSRKDVRLESSNWTESMCYPGVRYEIRCASLKARVDLAERLLELAQREEFLRAGKSAADEAEGLRVDLLTRKLYIEWAVVGIEGLRIDGKSASVASVIESGPMDLVDEMVSAIRDKLELTEEERKN